MSNNTSTILVLTRNFSNGLSVARSLGRAGYTVDMIASSHREGANDVASYSKYVREFVEVVSRKVGENSGDEELLTAISEYAIKHPETSIVIPTDDYTTDIVDNNRDRLAKHLVLPYVKGGQQGSISYLMDKGVQGNLAKQAGLLIPESWEFNLTEKVEIPKDMVYPCFVKPITSITGYKTEMAVCRDDNELLNHLLGLQITYANRSVLVQEYIDMDYELGSAGVCLDDRVVYPGMIKKTAKAEHSKGGTLRGEFVPTDIMGAGYSEKVIDFLKSLRYVGMFDLEFFVSGDKVYFNELNLRSSGLAFAYYHNSVNLAEIYVKHLLGQAISEEEETLEAYGKTIVYDKVAWEDYVHGYITKEELDEYIQEADYGILFYDEDPEPGERFIKYAFEERERGNRNKELRRQCLDAILANTKYTEEEANRVLDDARARLGIKYHQYRKLKFWEVPIEEQEQRYKEFLESRDLTLVDKSMPLVVVLSRNYATGLSIVRSLGAAGFTVDLVASVHKEENSKVTAASKFIRKNIEVVSGKNNALGKQFLCQELLRYKDLSSKPVLFPVDDYTAAVVDEFKKELEPIFIMPGIDDGRGSIMEYMDKTVQAELALQAGMNVPKSWKFDLRDEVVIPDDMVYPCFCKPLESFTGTKADIAKCDNLQELKTHLSNLKIKESKRCILVQEFINIDDEIDFSGLCLKDKVIIPAIIRKTKVAQFEKGVTLAGRVHPFEELDETLRNQIIETLKSFKYFGMFDMELNIVGDKIYFNEVNLRSGGPNYAYFKSGVNLPSIFVREALGLGHSEAEESVREYGLNFVYDKVAWEDYSHLYLNRRELNQLLESADFKLLDVEEDPQPGKVFLEKIEEESAIIRKKERAIKTRLQLRPVLGPVKRVIFRYPQTKLSNRRDPNGEKPRVMVVGRNYCSNLCMAKSLGEAGYDVEVLRVYQKQTPLTDIMRNIKPDAFSKFVKAYYICVTSRKPMSLVNRLIEIADPNKKMLIIPADDLAADIVDEYMELLRDYYLMPNINNTPGAISKMMNKGYQKELAKEFGLNVVNSCVIRTVKGKFEIPETVTYPCFIKPNISKNASKRAIRKCEDERELRNALQELSLRKDVEMIVEDFVDIDQEYSLLGLSTKDGVVGPGFFVAEEGGQEEHRGVALKGRILAIDEYKDLVDQLIAFVSTLNFNGLFDVDLIKTTDGQMYFVELNMRYGASGYAVTECGANLPAMFADYMFYGKPIDMGCKVTTSNKTFVSEKVVIDEYRMDRITWDQVKHAMSSADIYFIKDSRDRRPYNHFKKHYLEARRLRNLDRKMQADEE